MPASPSDHATFTQVCRELPALRPRVTQAALRALHTRAQGGEPVAIGGQTLDPHALAGLFVPAVRDGFPALVVAPQGAALLLRLYLAGALDTGGKPPGTPGAQLQAYVRGDAPWPGVSLARERQREAAARLAAPQALAEADFTPRLLDAVFRQHRGRGEGELEIGGLRVRRRLSKQLVGGRLAFGVHFEWLDAGGRPRVLSAVSGYSGLWTGPGPG